MNNSCHSQKGTHKTIDTIMLRGKYVDRSYIKSLIGRALSATAIVGSVAALIGIVLF